MTLKMQISSESGNDANSYKHILKRVKSVTKNPQDFLSIQDSKCEKIRCLVKDTYDFAFAKDKENKNNNEMLSELVLEELDEEQIWQLIELRNNILLPQFVENTSKLLSMKEDRLRIIYADENSNNTHNENAEYGDFENSDATSQDNEEFEQDDEFPSSVKKQKSKRKERRSVVDDKFFKLREMEAFLIAEEEKEVSKKAGKPSKDDLNINYFADDLDNSEEENIEYKDFFDDNSEEENSGDDEGNTYSQNEEENTSEGEEEGGLSASESIDNESGREESKKYDSDRKISGENEGIEEKSSFENREERLRQRIKDYEEDILGEKPWQLKGEVTATTRPQNSLLEEILEFESTTRPAPIITETTNIRLEDIIRQRIKSQAWDDVEIKIKPINAPKEYRKQLVLDQEKSKESLAQIYEKEYQKEMEKTNTTESKEEEPRSHKEIKSLMHSLFVKLDALSNFHFTPKPVLPEPKIITNTPAINLEEVAPIAVSDAKLLAPEEVRNRAKGDILGSNERSKTDKNRDRRHKKQKQRAIHKALEARDIEKQKLGIKLSKKEEQAKLTKSLIKNRQIDKGTISKDSGAHKSSKAFFTKLQETTTIQAKAGKRANQRNTNALSAKKLKL